MDPDPYARISCSDICGLTHGTGDGVKIIVHESYNLGLTWKRRVKKIQPKEK